MSEYHTDPSVEQKIDKLYRSLSTEQPPAALDRQILEAAHRAVDDKTVIRASSRTIWLRSLAYAAALVVGVSVVIEVSMQPEVMQTEPSLLIEEEITPAFKATLPDTGTASSKVSPDRGAKSEELRLRQIQRMKKVESKIKSKARRLASEPRSASAPVAERQMESMAAPAMDMMEQDEDRIQAILLEKPWRASPQRWLRHCQHLLAENKTDELVGELTEFRQQYTDYPVPKDLSNWLQRNSSPSLNP